MSIFSKIFSAVLGGVSSSAQKDAQKEDVKGKGREERATLSFASDLEYFRNQQQRKERSGALDSNYNQFSTVKNFAPYFKPGSGLDAVPTKPKPGDY
jgi:hypothetical protein